MILQFPTIEQEDWMSSAGFSKIWTYTADVHDHKHWEATFDYN